MEERGTLVVAAVLTAGTIAVATLAGMRTLRHGPPAKKVEVAAERHEPLSPALPGTGTPTPTSTLTPTATSTGPADETPSTATAPSPPAPFPEDERPPPGPPPPRADPHHAS